MVKFQGQKVKCSQILRFILTLTFSKPNCFIEDFNSFLSFAATASALMDAIRTGLLSKVVCDKAVWYSPDLFLTPMDWLLHRTDQLDFLGTTIGTEPFNDLDFADDVIPS